MFSSKDVPAVGVSIGIERVFNLLEDKIMAGCKDESGAVSGKIRETDTEVSHHAYMLLSQIESKSNAVDSTCRPFLLQALYLYEGPHTLFLPHVCNMELCWQASVQ